MNVRGMLDRTQKLLAYNSPAILTGIGAVGVVTTAYLASKASFKAYALIEETESVSGTAGDKKQRIKERSKLIWKLYIPAVTTGAATITCIICSNRVSSKRAAALASAYTISERAYSEYKEKVVETLGKAKEQKIKDEVAQDRVTKNPPNQSQVIITGDGDVLFQDARSGRYFTSTMEDVKKAQNDTNYEIINHCYASLTDFYNRLGLAPTKESDDIGWNSDKLLELSFSTTMTDDNKPCIVVDFTVDPVRNFFRNN